MHESIRIRFTRDGATLPVSHLDNNAGLVFAFETSAAPLGLGIGLTAGNPIVQNAMTDVRRIEDWRSDQFLLTVTRDDDSLVITGGGKNRPAESLPPGQYELRFVVSETRIDNEISTIEI